VQATSRCTTAQVDLRQMAEQMQGIRDLSNPWSERVQQESANYSVKVNDGN